MEASYNDISYEEAIVLLGMKLEPSPDDTVEDKNKMDRRDDLYKSIDVFYWPTLVKCYYETLDVDGRVEKFIQTNFEILREFARGTLSEDNYMKISEEDQRLKEFLDTLYVIGNSYNKVKERNNGTNIN